MAGEALDVFISYSHRDEGLKDELVNYHLKLLQREGKINTWQDRDIEAGALWDEEIRNNLDKADIILMLVTRHFLASDYCYGKEMMRAIERHEQGAVRVISVILSPCSWQYTPFQKLQVLPKDGNPVTLWDNREAAFVDVELGIRRVVDSIITERQAAEAASIQAAELQRQQAAARLKQERQEQERRAEARRQQEQAEAQKLEQERLKQERQAQERRAAERRQQEEAKRLKHEAEAERQRQQKLEAQRQEQERQQREAAERLRKQQAEAERQERERQQLLVIERQRQRDVAAARRQQGQTGIGRRRAIQIAGLGGGGLMLALATTSLFSERPQRDPETVELPTISGSSPDDLSAVEVQTVKVDNTGTITERPQGQVNAFREDLGNGISLDMVEIPAGEFVMGSPSEEEGRWNSEGPQRTVSVPRFFMGRFQVTQAQYEAVMGENPARFQGANRPVERVSWNDAVAFCEKLSQMAGRTYRLPSEAEWEYACRAGTITPFHFGPTITTDLANYNGNGTYGAGPKGEYREETTDVGSFPANAFGLHDMHGNVWEWCQDVWHDNYEGAPTDGSAWVDGGDQERKVLRGGSWGYNPGYCRSAGRYGSAPDFIFDFVGFRVVCGGA